MFASAPYELMANMTSILVTLGYVQRANENDAPEDNCTFPSLTHVTQGPFQNL
jgi:hypothetical protein